MGIPATKYEPSRTMPYLGLPSVPEAIRAGQEAYQRARRGELAFPAETVTERPEWRGAMGKIRKVASALQVSILTRPVGRVLPWK